ncbi:MAG: PAS domain S-box protein, partial [Thermodesulfovibrionales bacterium]
MTAQFLQGQLDYIFFFYGLAFILLAAICAIIRQEKPWPLSWGWLGLFGLSHGINEYLELIALGLGDSPFFSSLRLGVVTLAYCFLLEFGRDGLNRLQEKAAGRWIYIPLLLLAMTGGMAGIAGLNAPVRYSVGFIGGLLSSWALFRASRAEQNIRRVLFLAFIVMTLYTLSVILVVPKSAFFPASVINDASFLSFTGLPIQLIRGLLAIILAVAIWEYHRQIRWSDNPELSQNTEKISLQIIFSLVLVLVVGWVAVETMGAKRAGEERSDIRNQARIAAGALNTDRIKNLSGTVSDLGNPDYVRLRKQLMALEHDNPHLRWLYLMFQREGRILFSVDSIPEGKFGHTDPGVAYDQPPRELFGLFSTGQAMAVGPYSDEYGSFLSGFAAIRDPETNRVIEVIGIDINADEYLGMVARSRLAAIAITLLISSLFIVFFVFRQRLWEAAQIVAVSEKRLADAQRVAHLGSWTFNPRTQRISWSEEMARIFDLDPATGPPSYPELRRFIHPEDGERLDAAIQRAEEFELDLRVIRPDGAMRYIASKGEFRRSISGEVIELTVTSQDITDRKMAEEALKESEDRFRSIFESANTGIAFANKDGAIIQANQAFEKIVGYSVGELAHINFMQFAHAEDREKEMALLAELTEHKREHYRLEERYVTKAGKMIWVDIAVGTVWDNKRQPLYFVKVLNDITERKQAEAAIIEAKEKYTDLVNNLEVGVCRTTPGQEAEFLEANPEMVSMLEAGSREELMRHKVGEFYVNPERREQIIVKLIKSGAVRDEEVELQTLKGKKFWASITAIMKRDKAGQVYSDAIIRDITDQKEAVDLILELSLSDELTGLSNRRGFMTLAAQQLNIADRLKQGLVLIYADIDRMKWINDTLGHNEGDQALRNVAAVLKNTLRASDIIARIGGDEFAGLALETSDMTAEGTKCRL